MVLMCVAAPLPSLLFLALAMLLVHFLHHLSLQGVAFEKVVVFSLDGRQFLSGQLHLLICQAHSVIAGGLGTGGVCPLSSPPALLCPGLQLLTLLGAGPSGPP